MKQIRYGQIFGKLRIAAAVGCWLILCFSGAFGQEKNNFTYQPIQILKGGERIERPIKKDEVHIYTLSLKRGELLHIRIEQFGINIVAAIAKDEAERNPLKQLDETKDGAENFVFMAETAGKYMFGVFGFGDSQPESRYILQNTAPFATAEEKKSAAVELNAAGSKAGENKDYRLAILYDGHALGLLGDLPVESLTASVLFNLGNEYFALGNEYALAEKTSEANDSFRKAVEFYEKAAPIYAKFNDPADQGISFFNIGLARQNLKEYEKSTIAYQQAKPLLTAAKSDIVADALKGIGDNYTALSDYEKSTLFYEESLAAFEKSKDSENASLILFAIANNYYVRAEYEKSIEYYALSLKIFRAANDRNNQAVVLANIGLNFASLEQQDKAFDYLNQALILTRQLGNDVIEAGIYITIGQAYIETGRSTLAMKQFENALASSRRGKNASLETAALRGIGLSHSELGDYDAALKYHTEALKISDARKDESEQSIQYGNLGLAYMELGKYEKAFEYDFKSLEIDRRLKDRYGEQTILNNIGVAYLRLGSLKKAEEYIQKTTELSRELKLKRKIATSLSNLGTVYARLKQYDKAIGYFEQAMPMLEEQRNYRFQVTTNYYHGTVRREMGELDRAIELHTEAIRIARAAHTPKFEARAQIELGLDLLAQNKSDAALTNFQESLTIARTVKAREEEFAALDGLMQSYNRLNQKAMAIFYGKQSINLLQETRGEIVKFEKDVQTNFVKDNEQTYRQLAETLIAEGRIPEANQVLAMLKEEELSGFVRRDAKEIENLAKRADLRPNERTALEKYALFSSKVTQIGAELAKLDEARRLVTTNETFAEQSRYDELSAQLKDANTAFRIFLEKDLAAELGKEKKKEIEQDRALQGKLKDWGAGTVAISTVIGEDRYRVILTTPNAQIDGKTEIKAADLNAKIFAFREALLNPTIDPKPLGKELYDVLIKPIENDLEASNAKTLLWSLDGTLRYIPIAALWDGNQYLVQKYQNVIVTSTTRQSLQADVNKNWQILGAGVTKASEVTDQNTAQKYAFDELKSVAKELTAIVGDSKSPKGVSLLDAAFTENALKNELTQTANDKRKYNVVHFATHFRLGSDTADSFLLLGNNQALTLAEVADSPEMNLNGVELVTLSACNTGFGGLQNNQILTENNGKEVDSLAQFIELRGAKSVMATLWSVADESTAILMGEFYKLQKENQTATKAEILRQAQLELLYGKYTPEQAIDKNRSESVRFGASAKTMPKFVKDEKAPFAHPFYWSPFVLIGNWR